MRCACFVPTRRPIPLVEVRSFFTTCCVVCLCFDGNTWEAWPSTTTSVGLFVFETKKDKQTIRMMMPPHVQSYGPQKQHTPPKVTKNRAQNADEATTKKEEREPPRFLFFLVMEEEEGERERDTHTWQHDVWTHPIRCRSVCILMSCVGDVINFSKSQLPVTRKRERKSRPFLFCKCLSVCASGHWVLRGCDVARSNRAGVWGLCDLANVNTTLFRFISMHKKVRL